MTPERWQQVKEILHDALQKEPGERSAYVNQVCRTDASLRRDVESLLASGAGAADDFLKSAPPDPLPKGARLGPYEIVNLLGAGGMGEVYRARDTRLGRDVAIKVIPSSYSSDPTRRQRFQREARAISALQHPNICTLYDVGQQDGTDYLVMEYLEGETLASRLANGPLRAEQILTYGIETASALDAAHRQNIIHRDLKPGNILITSRGDCKVLDFGLAKLEGEDEAAPTITEPNLLSSPGVAMGTVPYMSPEQARGEQLDARTDIFSLGTVMYEMATGKMAFPGKTSAIIFKAILDSTPPSPSQLNNALPDRLDEVISKCLEKDRELRYQSAPELRADLKRLKRDSEISYGRGTGVTRMPQPVITVRKSHKWRLAAVLFVWAVLGSTAFWWYRHYKNTNEPERGIEVQSLADRSDVRRLAVSPDGSYVAYSPESNELRLLQVATKQDISIAQPSKDKIRQIVFSPDGNYLYFLRSSNGAGSGSGILRIAAVGGPTTRIVSDATDYGFSLSPDASRIAYLTETKSDSQITISRTDGSDRKILATRSANHPFWTPAWSPAGDEIAVIENLEDGNMQLDLVSVKDGKVRSIRAWPGAGQPAWSSDGSIVFLSVFKSMADPVWQIWSVNPNTGAGQPITSGTVDYYQWSLSPARSGDLAAIVFSYRTSIWIVDSLTPAVRRIPSFEGEGSNGVSWVGERIATTNPHSITVHSQDDKQIKTDSFYYVLRQVARCGPAKLVSFVAEDKGPPRFSYLELDSGRDVPFGEKADSVPSCSQDGSIAIYLRCDEKKECYLLSRKLPSGTPQPITSPGAPLFAPLISPDGKLVLAEKQPDPTKPLEWAVIIPTGKGSPQPISIPVPMDSVGANLAWNLGHFRWSPDGRSILFPVGQNGIDNIWSYPVAGGRAKQITHFDTDGIIAFDVDAKGRLVVCRGAMVRRPVLIHHSR